MSCPHGTILPQSKGNIKINQTDTAVRPRHNISWLDVPMKDAMGWTTVEIVQSGKQLTGPFDHLRL